MIVSGSVASLKEFKYFNTDTKRLSGKCAGYYCVNKKSGNNASCRIFLLGPVSISDHSGIDFAPRNQKSRALIAMLAVAPRGSRSRVWLRDKLWSDRGEDQGSASLRQALLDIRKSLGPKLRDILIADKYTVTLDLSRVRIDIFEDLENARNGNTDNLIDPELIPEFFLEGIDIRDSEFEDWLKMERQVWVRRYTDVIHPIEQMATDIENPAKQPDPLSRAAQIEGEKSAIKSSDKTLSAKPMLDSIPKRWSVILIRPTLTGNQAACHQVATQVSDALTRSMIETDDIRVTNFIDAKAQAEINNPDQDCNNISTNAHLALRVRVLQSAEQYSVGIELLRTIDCSLVWSAESQIESRRAQRGDISLIYGLICRVVDEVVRFFMTFNVSGQSVLQEQIGSAVHRMFRLSPGDLDAAEKTLRGIIRDRPSAQAYAWLAFTQTFRIGQRFSKDAPARIEEALYNANKALEINNSNALVLSLVAHIHSYLFSEYDVAAALFERAIRINPAQPMGWDLYAMLHAYVGQYDKARAMADWVQHLGEYSPFSYYFDTTKCIVSSLEGDYHASIAAGKRALCQQPKFNSILRYLISSNAHLGNMDSARELLRQLQTVEPDFTIGTLLDTGYPTLDTAGGRNFLAGLAKAGVNRS